MKINYRISLSIKIYQKLKFFTGLMIVGNIQSYKFNSRFFMNFVHDKAFINDKWIDGKTGKTFQVINPATEKVIGSVPDLDVDDVNTAITSAHSAFPEWSNIPATERCKILLKMKFVLEENTSDIAKIITCEMGKPITDALSEVKYCASFLEWFSEQGKRVDGEIYQSPIKDRLLLSIKQPIGVVALLTPWNFPLAMIMRKTSAALAAGCTCVIKPSGDTPLTALATADIAKKCELPKGVLNFVTVSHENAPAIGKLFCESPIVAGLSFTGSTEVGKILYRQCSTTVKRISLELGGNASFIVFNNANIDDAVNGGLASKFRNSGQTCVSANRFFIQEKVYDTFVDLMKTKMHSLKPGNGLVPGVNIGPLANLNQVEKVKLLVDDAVSKGAKLLKGGGQIEGKNKYFYHPTLLSEIKPNMFCYKEEIFGPVVACIRFKTEDDVIKMSNDTDKGLAGYFYSEDVSQIFRVAKKMEVGMVGVNAGLISSVEAPFGGVKQSGIGREGCHHGIDEYVNIKYICIGNLR